MQVLKLPTTITAPEIKEVEKKEKKVRTSYLHRKKLAAKAEEKAKVKGLLPAKVVEHHMSKTRYQKIAKRTEQMLSIERERIWETIDSLENRFPDEFIQLEVTLENHKESTKMHQCNQVQFPMEEPLY